MSEKKDIMSFFYENALGRIILKPLITAPVSRAMGWLLSKKVSKLYIKKFIKKNGIVMDDYIPREYASFNDFFTRDIIPTRRSFSKESEALCSPCDSNLLWFEINKDRIFSIKGINYTLADLVGEEFSLEEFENGDLLIFRLEATDYHHYAYFDDCQQGEHRIIDGKFHTVREIAYRNQPIFRENQRAVSLLKTRSFGEVLEIEVGALFVGKISNNHNSGSFLRGEEKGMFEFGGSTIILAFQKGRISLDESIKNRSLAGLETRLKMGEKIGIKGNYYEKD